MIHRIFAVNFSLYRAKPESQRILQPMQLSNSTSSYKRKQSNFTEVADLLDEIEEFENGTLEINESIAPIPIASFIISRNSKCNNNELKAILIK
ncbi:unnamed protein product, partial [Onchocerca ochengi]|uniref:Uncharacterized protein n=1 Tax=Onchocerca ochengi TaxID=42157 RepID=A0A182EQP8_ONCOC